jgi:uncharacterized protein (DUF1330 family)
MVAYLIVDKFNVSDPESIKDCTKKAGVTIKANGGKLLASGIPEALLYVN